MNTCDAPWCTGRGVMRIGFGRMQSLENLGSRFPSVSQAYEVPTNIQGHRTLTQKQQKEQQHQQSETHQHFLFQVDLIYSLHIFHPGNRMKEELEVFDRPCLQSACPLSLLPLCKYPPWVSLCLPMAKPAPSPPDSLPFAYVRAQQVSLFPLLH